MYTGAYEKTLGYNSEGYDQFNGYFKMTENVKYQSISHSVRVYALFHEILATYLY